MVAYVTSLCHDCKLSCTIGCEASVMSVSSQNRTVRMEKVGVTPSIPHLIPTICFLRMARLAIGSFDGFALNVSLMCSSASYTGEVILGSTRKLALVCKKAL